MVGIVEGGLVVTMVGRGRGERAGRGGDALRGERLGGWNEEVVRNVGEVKANMTAWDMGKLEKEGGRMELLLQWIQLEEERESV